MWRDTHLYEEKERGAVDALNRFLGDGAGLDGGEGEKNATQGDTAEFEGNGPTMIS